MRAPLPVVINRAAGTAAALGDLLEARVREAFVPTGREIALHMVEPNELAAVIASHAAAPVVAIGGGDGTLAAAAAQLSGRMTAIALLPLGTRNHLARQLGVPLDLDGAAEVAVEGARRRMDLGRAGDQIFLNNASLGMYSKLIAQRDRSERARWLANVPAAWQVLRTMRPQPYCLRLDGTRRSLRTSLLYVGNNRYPLDFGHPGERESPEDDALTVGAVAATRPLQLIWLALKVLLGLTHPERALAELDTAHEVIVDGEGEIAAALDGEMTKLSLPLHLAIEPGALGIVVPRVAAEQYRALTRTH